ncbi:hypothetical protein ACEWY4_017665 [Coilia grayii]|uniref:AIG1-type G domain-containing protein n=1 Tax=Coilia grayii TaxID=363190 RepID=A0ABD1JHG7_9TELE
MVFNVFFPKELRIVVLGYNRSGKTATINTFLRDGEPNEEEATHCMKREGTVDGRKVTLVDTAGWWKLYPVAQSAECIKRELVLSVSLCPPGPHVILLVVELDSPFSAIEETSVREHCELLGGDVWDHIIVLFTKGDLLVDTTIEEHIRRQGQALECLVKRCGGRYHVFDNKSECDQSQVKTLLDKVDRLTASKHGRPFEVDRMKLNRTEEAKKADKERALIFKQRVTEQRQRVEAKGDVLSLPEIRILLVGWVLSGKSYSGDIILNHNNFSPGKVTEKATCGRGHVLGRNVTVVDTPGWWKFLPSMYTPERVKQELKRGISLCGKDPHAILLTLTADMPFHEEQRRLIEDTLEAFLGKDVWRHVIILFTFGYLLKEIAIEEVIQSEGEALQWLVEKCGNRYHLFSKKSQDNGQVADLLQKIDKMVSGNCVFCPDTEVNKCAEVGVKRRSTETDPCIEDVINTLDKEWLRTDQKMIEEVQKEWIAAIEVAHKKQKSNRSMNDPPKLQEEQESVDINEEKDQGKFQDKPPYDDKLRSDKSDEGLQRQHSDDDTLSDHLKDLLECEWRRRDYIIKEIVREAVQELKESFGNPSEPDQRELQESREKVVVWLPQTFSDYGSITDPNDSPPNDSKQEDVEFTD